LITVTWLGHSTVLLDLDGARLVTDPVLRNRVGPLVRTAAPLDADAVGRPDAVLLSHLHADHADVPSLRRVASTATVIAPRGSGGWLASRGMRDVHELAVGETVRVGPVSVTATAAAHDGRRWPLGSARAEPVGYLVAGSSTAYFAGDTDLVDAMASLAGVAHVALLPVAGWGAKVGAGHLDAERAAEAAVRIRPRVAIPIHWGTFAPRLPLNRHPEPARPPREFAELVSRRAPQVEVRVLAPGERTTVE
jgi:L-ascorbate metabolism protein UlaG (beta-lactamase superfamily)